MQFFVILPNGSKIDIELDSDKKVVDIISIMDKSDRIQSLGLIDHFHLWFQPESGGKVNLMKDLNKTIGDYGITLESNINMQVEHTTLLEIAMNISKSRREMGIQTSISSFLAPMPTSKLRIREGSKWSGLFLHEALFNILAADVNYDIERWAGEFSSGWRRDIKSGAKKKKYLHDSDDQRGLSPRYLNHLNPIQFTKIFYQWYLDNIVQLDQTEIDNFIKENNIRYTSKSGYSKKDKPKKNKPKKKKQTQKKEKKKKKKKKN